MRNHYHGIVSRLESLPLFSWLAENNEFIESNMGDEDNDSGIEFEHVQNVEVDNLEAASDHAVSDHAMRT